MTTVTAEDKTKAKKCPILIGKHLLNNVVFSFQVIVIAKKINSE